MPWPKEHLEEQADWIDQLKQLRDRLDRDILPVCAEKVVESRRGDFSDVLLLFMRVIFWVRTLCKLEFGEDYQTFASGARAVFELAIDLVLLEQDATGEASAKMKAFELRQRLKQARKVQTYAEKRLKAGRSLEDLEEALGYKIQDLQKFVDDNATREGADKAHFRPRTSSQRWTGKDLGKDANAIDALGSNFIFSDFYAFGYSWHCWHVHGTTLAVLRGLGPNEIFITSALASSYVWQFSIIAIIAMVRKLGLEKDPRVITSLGEGFDKTYPVGSSSDD